MSQKKLIKQYPELETCQEELVEISRNGLRVTLDGNFSVEQLNIIVEVMEKVQWMHESKN
jgi:hypothetical protein